jgi:hypothetical protein
MQSYDPSRQLPKTHCGRNLAIGGSATLIAGVLLCLPILTLSLASASCAAKMPLFAASISNTALKGDPLSRPVNGRPGRGTTAAPAIPKQTTEASVAAKNTQGGSGQVGATSKRRLPIGCESAFGSLVRADNAARCVTDLARPTRWAMAGYATRQAVGM